MRRLLAITVAAGLAAATPGFAQSDEYEPIPVPHDAPAGSSGSVGGSLGSAASTGSGILAVVGLAALVLIGVAVSATN